MTKPKLNPLSILLLSCFLITSYASSSTEETPVVIETASTTDESIPLSFQGFAICGEVICWNGIISGVTTFEDATSIIEGIYEQEAISIDQRHRHITWETKVSDNLPGGYIRGDDSGIVYDLIVSIPNERVSISEVNEWIGEPDLVYVARAISSENRCAGSSVTYPDLGIMAFLSPENNTIGISPTQYIGGITLMRPEIVKGWTVTDTWIIEWQGYTDYCAKTEQLK